MWCPIGDGPDHTCADRRDHTATQRWLPSQAGGRGYQHADWRQDIHDPELPHLIDSLLKSVQRIASLSEVHRGVSQINGRRRHGAILDRRWR